MDKFIKGVDLSTMEEDWAQNTMIMGWKRMCWIF